MTATETVVISNELGSSSEWMELSDGTHKCIQCENPEGLRSLQDIYIGDEAPLPGSVYLEYPQAFRIRIEHPNTRVWGKIKAGATVTVIRGNARVIVS